MWKCEKRKLGGRDSKTNKKTRREGGWGRRQTEQERGEEELIEQRV